MKVYVAGPMRNLPQFNFPAFDAAKVRLEAAGWDGVSPADIDRSHGFNPVTDAAEDMRVYAKRDTEALLSCDAIAMLPGWTASKGATAEYHFARWIGLKVLDAETLGPLEADDTILDEAKRCVYSDRAKDYGHPLDECQRIAAFWSIILGCEVRAAQVPLCMIALKISREMNARKQDNAVDIAGYAECLDRIHRESERRKCTSPSLPTPARAAPAAGGSRPAPRA
jgi:hypothetical protein